MGDDSASFDPTSGAVASEGTGRPAGESGAEASAARDDEALMAEFAGGSPEAFDELFDRYKQPVFGFFWRRVGERSLAEELTQDTFVAVIRASRRYRSQATFRTYLYAIAFKILHAHRRKAAFRATFFGLAPAHEEPMRNSSLEAQLLVREALGKLDHTDREVLLLREFEQLSYSEIAGALGAPVNTVRSRLFRARTALRETLSAAAPTTVAPTAVAELRAQEEHS